MHESESNLIRNALRSTISALAIGLAISAADPASATVAQEPLTVTRAIRPIVMLALSNDHQLYKVAYDDNIDIDKDGTIETSYDNGYEYYGYFISDRPRRRPTMNAKGPTGAGTS
jgi:type IV pilus assembly protein PilY1